jgi:cytochrome P450
MRNIQDRMRDSSAAALRHFPGDYGLPLFGETFEYLKDPFGWSVKRHRQHGKVFRTYMLFQASLSVAGADLAERILVDKDQNFSSELGWGPAIGRFFAGGLMLRDFDVHRLHRRIMQVAFKREALVGYAATMRPILERHLPTFGNLAYPWAKQTTLDAAASIFMGLDRPEDLSRVNKLFSQVVVGASAAFRWNLPGTTYGRGVRSREELANWIAALIPSHRAGDGKDMLSVMCGATSETGERFEDKDIVDHLLFLLMAAHDTTTSALTTLIMELGRQPEWQERAREEARTVTSYDLASFEKLTLVYDCFREVLRLYPPVRAIPRRTVREIEIKGHRVPANTLLWVNVEENHRDSAIYTDPDRFDPERFSEARAEHKKHRFAWTPFGGGAHTCLGLQFSELQVKMLMHMLLTRYRWTCDASQEMKYLPFIKPKNNLPFRVTRV